MLTLDELIRGTFDFEREDQPEKIEEYNEITNFMWLQCAIENLDEKMYDRIKEIINSGIEPERVISFFFLPGKIDTRDLLIYANNFYLNSFLPNRDFLINKLSRDVINKP